MIVRFIGFILAMSASCASAQPQEFRMTCRGEQGVYLVVFDNVRQAYTNTNPQFTPPWKIKRTQVDEDGALVWASVRVHYGERDALAFFGRQKWVRYFYGNGSVVEDTCRN
jgi:hypothetical protein